MRMGTDTDLQHPLGNSLPVSLILKSSSGVNGGTAEMLRPVNGTANGFTCQFSSQLANKVLFSDQSYLIDR